MADFVAVIRRAVDGLSDNNAEMRQKVYEKARGAVRRQLESMNPRPSDDLVKRQLDKLEAAIVDVEGDHAEALPAEEPVEEVVQEELTPFEEPVAEPEPVKDPEPEPAVEDPAEEEPPVDEPAEEPVVDEPEPEPEPVVEEEPVREEPVIEPEDHYVPSWHDPEPEIAAEAGAETVELHEPEPERPSVHEVELPEPVATDEARVPPVETHWDWSEPAVQADGNDGQPAADPLAWEWPGETPGEPEAKPVEPVQRNDWTELDNLIGAGATAKAEPAVAAAATTETGFAAGETARAPQRSFKAEPRKSRFNLGALVATVAFLAIAGGAGAAYWFNRDAVNGWVETQIAALTGPSADTPAETPQKTTETAEGGRSLPAETPPAETVETDNNNTDAAPPTEVASAAQNGGKFTQRLRADGSEVDEGPAPALDGVAAEEGKSVAAQTTETAGLATDAGQTPEEGAEGAQQTPAGTDTATTTEAQTPAATGDQAAGIGVTQKMFLYEERLGQTGPTAIEGTVAWSSAEESPGGDAKPEPVVRAQINVPTKGLTALVTFRRNADRSLPASHIIELVFSLPENFEGGGIESVQRVAMKRTEQDRGDVLIAVPAKITDDFHMIALNDFPEAIAKNTELLRTRSWIDIPITYRNGRRALLTLDKGTAGAEAFDTAMKAWTAAGSPNSQ